MPQIVSCGECGKKFKVGDDKGGKRIKCSGCGGIIQIPLAEEQDPWDVPGEAEDDFDSIPSSPRLPPPVVGRTSASRPAVKRSKKSSGGGKGLLIAGIVGGVMAVLALIGVGGYFAYRHLFAEEFLQFSNGSTTYSINLAWVPPAAGMALLLQPTKAISSDLVRDLDLEKKLAGPPNRAREILKTIDLAMATHVPKAGRGEPAATILHFSTPSEIRERFKDLLPLDKWQQAEAGGKTYYRYTAKISQDAEVEASLRLMGFQSKSAGNSDVALYAPDDRNAVVGTEESIKSVLTTSYSKTALRSLLKKADLQYEVSLVGVMGNASSNSSDTENFRKMLPESWKNSPIFTDGNYKSMMIGVGISTPNLLQMTFEAKDVNLSSITEKEFQRAKAELQQQVSSLGALGATPFAALGTLGTKLVDGITVESKGLMVTFAVKKPENFNRELVTAIKPFESLIKNAAAGAGGGGGGGGAEAPPKSQNDSLGK